MKRLDNLNAVIKECESALRNSPKHHLPLPHRNKLLEAIGDDLIVGRLSLLCAVKVYPLWNRFMPKDLNVHNLLLLAEEYLMRPKDENILLAEAGKLQSYVDDKNDEVHFSALYAGYSAVNAAYEVTGKYIDASDEDDFEIDSSNWDSTFWASLAYNGGAADFDKIDYEKSRKFWMWYLREALSIAYSDKEIVPQIDKLPTENRNKEFVRSKTDEINNDDEINSCITEIQNKLCKAVTVENWSRIEYTENVIDDAFHSDAFCYVENQKVKMQITAGIEYEITKILDVIKARIYSINGEEGTFWTFQLIIGHDGNKQASYLYDTKIEDMKRFRDDEFLADMKKFPRSKNFIPTWLSASL